MRIPTAVFLTGASAALCLACADPTERPQAAEPEAEPRDVSLLESPADDAVLSPIEAGETESADHRPTGSPQHDPAVHRAHTTQTEDPNTAILTALPRAEPTALAGAAAGPVDVPALTLPRARATPAFTPGSAAAAKGVDPDAGMDDAAPARGRGVIIRGGVGIEDDCAIHLPGRPAQGTLINERGPRVGLPTFPRGGFR